ncbi:peptidase M50B family protein [Kocuria tytonicola]|uniref:site-2 protease family protein n=1 Tax=Kocuria tytonicola TaxID=2055946 RepID=UPI000EF8B1AA|nr:site-2 protease family protein [Kocuria tytonicola]RLZ03210.1 peptidase M50B family protein [Kocuria tytonicola]
MPAPRDSDPAHDDDAPAAAGATRPRGVRLGRVTGVELFLDRSWFVIAALTVVMYGPVLWRLYPQLGWVNLLLALGFAVGLALSVLVHELAHAAAGRAAGWPVTRIVLTLMGGHTAFGAVHSRPLPTALVSLAGPLSNVALAAAGTVGLSFVPESAAGPVWALAELVVLANWVLGVFNLLPGLPLDGGRVVESVIWAVTGSESRGTVVAAWFGRAIAAGVLAWAMWTGQWRQPAVIAVTLLVAGFIYVGAGQALKQSRLMGVLDAVRAGDIARPAVEFAPTTPLSTVDAAVVAVTGDGYRGWTPDAVARDPRRRALGVLDPALAARVPGPQRSRVAMGDVAAWVPDAARVTPEVRGGDLVRFLEARGLAWAWVVDGADEVLGVVHHEDLARYALRG